MGRGETFFQLIKSAVFENDFVCADEISEKELLWFYKISKHHDLAHLLGYILEKQGLLNMGTESQTLFLQERKLAVYRYEQMQFEFEQICRILEENKIAHIPLKGAVLREYYPEPWMRTSCDIDILVKKEDLQAAIDKLVQGGFQYEETQIHDAHLYSESGVHLELHFDLMEDFVNKNFNAVLSTAWEQTKPVEGWEYRLQFSEAFFYFFHIAHMAKHFANGGCGVRSFLDLWILNQARVFQSEEAENLIKEANLLNFMQKAEKLSNVWFGEEAHDEVTKEMQSYIVGAGVYGTMDNQLALKQVEMGGKKKHLISRIFLPYDLLKKSYPKLEKYPILLPFYHIKRWCRIVFGKNNKRAFQELKTIATASEEKKQRLVALCENLGLNK